MKTYVTMADIAREAGVSVMTVSLALRDAPRIPETTRRRIAELARTMGYQPNPMLSSLAAYRQQCRPASYQSTIAVISNHVKPDLWRGQWPHQLAFWEGAEGRGRELGFQLEEFWLREPGMTPARASRILVARNISGLLLLPQPRSRSHLRLGWEHFSPVAFGYSLTRPQLHIAAVHHFHAGMLAMRKLRGLGYRRIGFAAFHEVVERANLSLMGGVLVEQNRVPLKSQVPSLILPRAELTPAVFERWYLEHRPDAILASGPWRELLLGWLEAMKVDVPGELGVAFSSVVRGDGTAGVDENTDLIGAKALELVKAMIDRGEKGVPTVPQRILVEGTWQQGSTVRRLTG